MSTTDPLGPGMGEAGEPGLDRYAKEAFSGWLETYGERRLRHRRTRENIASHVDGHLSLLGTGESVAAIQEAAGFSQGRRKGPLFGLIGHGGWEGEAARLLAERSVEAAPRALAVDLSEHRSGGRAYEVFSIHSVHDSFTAPLDWGRVQVESEEVQSDVESRCREMALDLVDGYRSFLVDAHRRPLASRLPVVSRQQALAENSPLRPELARRGVEYALGITDEYDAAVRIDPGLSPVSEATPPEAAFLEPHGAIRHHGGAAVELRDTRMSSGRMLDEHLVQIGDNDPLYFIARGRLDTAQRMAAYRLARRSIEVAAIAAGLPATPLADPYGVAFFNHHNDACWRRHMLLVSLYECFRLEGQLT